MHGAQAPGALSPDPGPGFERGVLEVTAGIAACGLAVVGGSVLHHGGLTLPEIAVVPWAQDHRSPFLVAASVFGAQAVVSLVASYVIATMKELCDWWGHRFQRTLKAYACLSAFGAVMYSSMYTAARHAVVDTPGIGQVFIWRYFHWSMSTPMQWFAFSQVCTRVGWRGMLPVYVSTVLMQAFGCLAACMPEARYRWGCFLVSSAFFVVMFGLVFTLPVVPDMAGVGRNIRCCSIILWSIYPVAVLARWSGLVDAWAEQVLIFSVLDVSAKGVMFSGIIVSRAVLSLASLNGTVQLMLASQDVMLVVNADFQVLKTIKSPLLSHYFGEGRAGSLRLLNLCINEEHSGRILEAARRADSQHLSGPTPKALVALKLPGGGGEILVECIVSKCLHGQRVIGLAVASQSGNSDSAAAAGDHPDAAGAPDALSDSASSANSRSVEVRLALALHNCTGVLQLDDAQRTMVNRVFVQSRAMCAMIVWEARNGEDQPSGPPGAAVQGTEVSVVAASPPMQWLFFLQTAMPQSLSSLLPPNAVSKIALAMAEEHDDVVLHQWQRMPVHNGTMFRVSALPLNRMSRVAASSSVRLGILLLEVLEQSPSALDITQPDHLGWYCAGGQLACMGLGRDSSEQAPARQEDRPVPRVLASLAMNSAAARREA